MQLLRMLNNITGYRVEGSLDKQINSIHYDSRQAVARSLFFCIEGLKYDGHKFAADAVLNGAHAVVLGKDISLPESVTKIFVHDTRLAMALMAKAFYGNPSSGIDLIGVTGTNGKTTVTYLVKSILDTAGKKTGLIGTIVSMIGDKKIYSERTTPESLDLQKLFGEMADCGVESIAIEVSSHSLALKRVAGCDFKAGIFTNLTRDHLDFHGTFENYRQAKASLFDISECSVINIDDENGRTILNGIKKSSVTYGIEREADVYARDIEVSSKGVKFRLHLPNGRNLINLKIPGIFSVYNGLAAASAMYSAGITPDIIKAGLEAVAGVPGRFELLDTGTDYSVILDYAHTPDGLENILKTAREFAKGRVITLFGCGGDRDPGKRPVMGEIAAKYSDLCVVTSDNPRTEEPMSIIEDILPGVRKANCSHIVVENRRSAIETALAEASTGDVVILAGKGHETYQILKDKIIHFDEREIVAEILKGGQP